MSLTSVFVITRISLYRGSLYRSFRSIHFTCNFTGLKDIAVLLLILIAEYYDNINLSTFPYMSSKFKEYERSHSLCGLPVDIFVIFVIPAIVCNPGHKCNMRWLPQGRFTRYNIVGYFLVLQKLLLVYS